MQDVKFHRKTMSSIKHQIEVCVRDLHETDYRRFTRMFLVFGYHRWAV
jgi:hypothetical protein